MTAVLGAHCTNDAVLGVYNCVLRASVDWHRYTWMLEPTRCQLAAPDTHSADGKIWGFYFVDRGLQLNTTMLKREKIWERKMEEMGRTSNVQSLNTLWRICLRLSFHAQEKHTFLRPIQILLRKTGGDNRWCCPKLKDKPTVRTTLWNSETSSKQRI